MKYPITKVPNRIYLLGFMGVGKSFLGQTLSNHLKIRLIDLDKNIEAASGKSINKLFETVGESGFRLLEQQQLKKTFQLDNVIVALGGGCPCFFDNMEQINKHGTSLFIDASTSFLYDRLIKERSSRPVLHGQSDDELKSFVNQLLKRRLPYYQQAKLQLYADRDEDFLSLLASLFSFKLDQSFQDL